MEEKLNTLKQFLIPKPVVCDNFEPEIGFRVTLRENRIIVKVIGARKLPTRYGSFKPHGFMVKVRIFPDKEKHETAIVKESWPTFNEELTFELRTRPRNYNDYFKGKFVSLTVYAVLENEEIQNLRTATTKLKRFFSFNGYENQRNLRRNYRHSMNNTRTIGAATYQLNLTNFNQKMKDGSVSTPDIWRNLKEISSGLQVQPKEGKKGCVEVTLTYAISEDGRNDVVEVGVTRLRCSMQTMQEHEKLGGQLYLKITAFEYEDLIQKMKSDKFEPTISLKMEQKTAHLRATVNNYNIDQVKILIRLISKNVLGKKMVVGRVEIDRHSEIWKESVATPSQPVIRMLQFE